MDSTTAMVPWNLVAMCKLIEARGGFLSLNQDDSKCGISYLLLAAIVW